jgi:3-polyprenyl-4-hydroxybenzoate decarboxylase
VSDVRVFCAGCLVVGGPAYAEDPEFAARVARDPAFSEWPLLVVTDEPARAVRSPMNFLWTTFTRFEPARDIAAAAVTIRRNHLSYSGPIAIDARLKPGFPAELFCDDAVAGRVTRRWTEYFPAGGVAMGDSARAHLD